MTSKMNGATYFARLLEAYGVTHVFFMDAVLRRALAEMEDTKIKRILGHSEKGVGYMADGYARISGKPGLCFAQSVGAANLAASLQDPYLGYSPVIAMTGRHVAAMQYRNSYQEVEHGPLFTPVTKFHAQMEVIEQMPHLIRQAFREATTGAPRPVHLDIAGFTGDAITPHEADFPIDVDQVHTRFPAFRPAPDPAVIAQAVAAIAKSKQPVIIGDRGVVIAGADEALRAFGEKIQAPITTTLDAKSTMVEGDTLFRGMAGLYGRTCTNRMIDQADLVIYVGSNTSDHTTGGWKLPKSGTPIIQIDIDPVELGRNYPNTIGILSDVGKGLEALTAAATRVERGEWLASSKKLVDDWWQEQLPELTRDEVPMRPQRLCRLLTEVLPEDAILVADTGYSALWSGNLVELHHRNQTFMRAAGSLGWSFPAAIGAKAAAPERTVVCFTGDGGFAYHLPELETARRWGLNTITIVNNNHCLSQGVKNLNIAYSHREEDGRKSECYVYRETDFAKVAQSFDCFGITVERPEDFKAAFAAALASNLPAVIDVKTEFAYQAQMAWMPS
ncbi:thiamine pyrophosphate-binding protein [Polynucleobacter kasalickyi]|uniref:Acetolactate synthase-1/2/3 large subunit n=1 Tax=Polynucleobacter kasalickyi TaxID=1938817 RepID=A0A1W2AM21_9BURK|nr:thiamine pyrophosphate-binding protein [Polynucleobacter kasalickyi]SMC61580.1 acetolactate synthase-1/2/3 large subunit [Polynucleobacter kasalickyi]